VAMLVGDRGDECSTVMVDWSMPMPCMYLVFIREITIIHRRSDSSKNGFDVVDEDSLGHRSVLAEMMNVFETGPAAFP